MMVRIWLTGGNVPFKELTRKEAMSSCADVLAVPGFSLGKIRGRGELVQFQAVEMEVNYKKSALALSLSVFKVLLTPWSETPP